VWADRPHPAVRSSLPGSFVVPIDPDLLNVLGCWTDSTSLQHTILAENRWKLCDFD